MYYYLTEAEVNALTTTLCDRYSLAQTDTGFLVSPADQKLLSGIKPMSFNTIAFNSTVIAKLDNDNEYVLFGAKICKRAILYKMLVRLFTGTEFKPILKERANVNKIFVVGGGNSLRCHLKSSLKVVQLEDGREFFCHNGITFRAILSGVSYWRIDPVQGNI